MKRKIKNTIYCILICFCTAPWAVLGQTRQYYHKDPNALLERQSETLLKKIYKVLENNPPDTLASDNRKLALYALDALYHDTRLDTSKAIQNHFEFIVKRIINELNTPPKAQAAIQVLKIYNQGFIIRDKDITIAIDLVRGPSRSRISKNTMQELVDKADILFITHRHGDHADKEVADMFSKQNKPVLLPPGLWEGESSYYQHLRDPNTFLTTQIKLPRKKTLIATIFPGHQGDLHNNLYTITFPSNITISHTGDQANKNDLDWIKEIKNNIKTDILLLHCWMPNMKEAVNGFDPKLIITGHENEMGHSIDHREPFWLTLEKMEDIEKPSIVMAWGENYWFTTSSD